VVTGGSRGSHARFSREHIFAVESSVINGEHVWELFELSLGVIITTRQSDRPTSDTSQLLDDINRRHRQEAHQRVLFGVRWSGETDGVGGNTAVVPKQSWTR